MKHLHAAIFAPSPTWNPPFWGEWRSGSMTLHFHSFLTRPSITMCLIPPCIKPVTPGIMWCAPSAGRSRRLFLESSCKTTTNSRRMTSAMTPTSLPFLALLFYACGCATLWSRFFSWTALCICTSCSSPIVSEREMVRRQRCAHSLTGNFLHVSTVSWWDDEVEWRKTTDEEGGGKKIKDSKCSSLTSFQLNERVIHYLMHDLFFLFDFCCPFFFFFWFTLLGFLCVFQLFDYLSLLTYICMSICSFCSWDFTKHISWQREIEGVIETSVRLNKSKPVYIEKYISLFLII